MSQQHDEIIREILARKLNKNKPDIMASLSSVLTPETLKREMINIMCKLSANAENVNNQDPRIYNNPLPNDAVITKKYGHRSFTSDLYPGFVWYNGFWHKESADLHFKELTSEANKKLLNTGKFKTKTLSIGMIDMSICMDDAFYPVKIDGVRVFLREVWYDDSYSSTISYLPEIQGCSQSLFTRFTAEGTVVYEDTSYIALLNTVENK